MEHWTLTVALLTSTLILSGCCEEQKTVAPEPPQGEERTDSTPPPKETDKPVNATPSADAGQEAATPEPVKEVDPAEVAAKEEADRKRFAKLAKVPDDDTWEVSHAPLGNQGELVFTMERDTKGAEPKFKAVVLDGENIVAEESNLVDFIGDKAKFKRLFPKCDNWNGPRAEPFDLGQTRIIKVSTWCNNPLDEDRIDQQELVLLLAPGTPKDSPELPEGEEERELKSYSQPLKDMQRVWMGVGSSTIHTDGECTINTSTSFESADGELLRVTTVATSLYEGTDATFPPPDPEKQPERAKCAGFTQQNVDEIPLKTADAGNANPK